MLNAIYMVDQFPSVLRVKMYKAEHLILKWKRFINMVSLYH